MQYKISRVCRIWKWVIKKPVNAKETRYLMERIYKEFSNTCISKTSSLNLSKKLTSKLNTFREIQPLVHRKIAESGPYGCWQGPPVLEKLARLIASGITREHRTSMDRTIWTVRWPLNPWCYSNTHLRTWPSKLSCFPSIGSRWSIQGERFISSVKKQQYT